MVCDGQDLGDQKAKIPVISQNGTLVAGVSLTLIQMSKTQTPAPNAQFLRSAVWSESVLEGLQEKFCAFITAREGSNQPLEQREGSLPSFGEYMKIYQEQQAKQEPPDIAAMAAS